MWCGWVLQNREGNDIYMFIYSGDGGKIEGNDTKIVMNSGLMQFPGPMVDIEGECLWGL